MRLQQFLSRAGVSSRRAAEQIILSSKVKVNGQIINHLGTLVDETKDLVEINNQNNWKTITLPDVFVVYALNKPIGYATTVSDPHFKKNVMELVPKEPRVVPIGRLDSDSEGLLLLTNNGDLVFDLTHPSRHITKTYFVTCKAPLGYDQKALRQNITKLESGVMLDGKRTAPAKIRLIDKTLSADRTLRFSIQISEGRNRQIRRSCQKIGLDVIKLVRNGIGKLSLDELNIQSGHYRILSSNELKKLK